MITSYTSLSYVLISSIIFRCQAEIEPSARCAKPCVRHAIRQSADGKPRVRQPLHATAMQIEWCTKPTIFCLPIHLSLIIYLYWSTAVMYHFFLAASEQLFPPGVLSGASARRNAITIITTINRLATITTINRIAIITTMNRIAIITTINRIAIITTINRIASHATCRFSLRWLSWGRKGLLCTLSS